MVSLSSQLRWSPFLAGGALAADLGGAGALGSYRRISGLTSAGRDVVSSTVAKYLPSRVYAMDSPNGSSFSGVIRGWPLVMAPATSPPVTSHSYASV